MNNYKLYMLLLGCKPTGRFTEQHDVFFGIGESIAELIPELKKFWTEAENSLHVDAWREVTQVGHFSVKVVEKKSLESPSKNHLFFINLGGYKASEFEEFHQKMVVVAENKEDAIRLAKKTAFYKQMGFTSAPSHVDDKYVLDVDDFFEVIESIPITMKNNFALEITENKGREDEIHLGYFTLEKLKKI